MSNRNKEKGKSWERDTCKIMERIFGGSWIRVPNSGAFIGGLNQSRMDKLSAGQIHNSKGDIIPPDEYDIVVECKSYKDFPFNTLLGDGCALLNGWIDQVETDILDDNEFYFITFKINNKGSYIVVNTKFLSSGLKTSKNFSMYNHKEKVYLITDFIPFLEENAEIIKKLSIRNQD